VGEAGGGEGQDVPPRLQDPDAQQASPDEQNTDGHQRQREQSSGSQPAVLVHRLLLGWSLREHRSRYVADLNLDDAGADGQTTCGNDADCDDDDADSDSSGDDDIDVGGGCECENNQGRSRPGAEGGVLIASLLALLVSRRRS